MGGEKLVGWRAADEPAVLGNHTLPQVSCAQPDQRDQGDREAHGTAKAAASHPAARVRADRTNTRARTTARARAIGARARASHSVENDTPLVGPATSHAAWGRRLSRAGPKA